VLVWISLKTLLFLKVGDGVFLCYFEDKGMTHPSTCVFLKKKTFLGFLNFNRDSPLLVVLPQVEVTNGLGSIITTSTRGSPEVVVGKGDFPRI